VSKIIFGPVHSRRFGKSLGVDLSPATKQCNFDCLYCELEPAKTMESYQSVVPLHEVVGAIKEALQTHKEIDYITFTANGEPTLYPHLSKLIDEVNRHKGRIKTLILSNAATIDDPTTQEALLKLDEVKLSLDCATQRCLKKLDRAHSSIDVERIKEGMLRFKAAYHKPLIVEILFVKNINDTPNEIEKLNRFLIKLNPTRIDIGTIDRPPAYKVEALSYEALHTIAKQFDAHLPLYIASRKRVEGEPSHYTRERILETLSMRPLTREDVEILFDAESRKRFETLLQKGLIERVDVNGVIFFKKVS
jgi:wyosine [tRNA(Phe)-imidazoG37] synthetase (radical SAM superfamily)